MSAKMSEHQRLISFKVCQQKWLQMEIEAKPIPTTDVLWNTGRGNP